MIKVFNGMGLVLRFKRTSHLRHSQRANLPYPFSFTQKNEFTKKKSTHNSKILLKKNSSKKSKYTQKKSFHLPLTFKTLPLPRVATTLVAW